MFACTFALAGAGVGVLALGLGVAVTFVLLLVFELLGPGQAAPITAIPSKSKKAIVRRIEFLLCEVNG